ncbi:MAG TPA: AAA family ATPase [Bacillota bacterium]|nr:AAA family ATPase [Bacillota bacterium]
MRLLAVDPHREESSWIQTLQKDLEFRTRTVGTGEEAVEELRQNEFDAMLIYSILPDMTGAKLASLIRKLQPEISTFIIAHETSMELWRESVKSKSQLLPLPLDISKLRFILNTSHSEMAATVEEIEVVYEDEEEEEELEELVEPQGDIKLIPQEPVVKSELRRNYRHTEDKGKLIVLYSWKGGVGKTTTSANLATIIQTYSKKSVGLVELTRQTGNILSHFSLVPSVTIRHWIEEKTLPKDVRGRMLEDPATGLFVLPTQSLIDESENPVKVTERDALRIVRTLREVFDVVIIDAGTIMDEVLYTLLREADHILLISNMSMETLQENHYMPEIMRRRKINTDRLIHVLNMAQKGMGLTIKEAMSMVDAPVTHMVHFRKQIQQRKKEREPFVLSHHRHPYTEELCQLTGYLFPDIEELQVKENWLKRIVKKVSG